LRCELIRDKRRVHVTMVAATTVQIVLAVMVVLNLIGLTIAAYRIMKKK
jgi:hypothetical protein